MILIFFPDFSDRYLNLPSSPSALLESPHLTGLARKWANHPHVHIMLNSPSNSSSSSAEAVGGAAAAPVTSPPKLPPPPMAYPLKTNGLITLPEDYSDLINSVSSFTCTKSMTRVPTMCLVKRISILKQFSFKNRYSVRKCYANATKIFCILISLTLYLGLRHDPLLPKLLLSVRLGRPGGRCLHQARQHLRCQQRNLPPRQGMQAGPPVR